MYDKSTLEQLPLSGLKVLYQDLFNAPPPIKSRRDFLLGNISWVLQSDESGKKYSLLRQKLISQASKQVPITKTHYLTGTRIIREWNGVTYEVIVEDDGFRWKQKKYRSLSKIAREITGARWSGPRFFGLKNYKSPTND